MTQPPTPKTILVFKDEDGNSPFSKWLKQLRDPQTVRRIQRRIARLEVGNYGDFKYLTNGDGVMELRLSFGPGYRVYFAEDGNTVVLLLFGGDKDSQRKDIQKAKSYWNAYQELKK